MLSFRSRYVLSLNVRENHDDRDTHRRKYSTTTTTIIIIPLSFVFLDLQLEDFLKDNGENSIFIL